MKPNGTYRMAWWKWSLKFPFENAYCLLYDFILGALIVSSRSFFISFFGLGNHNTLSWFELVRFVFKIAQYIIKAISVDILHPKFCLTHCLDILLGLDFIFSYSFMNTLRSAIIFIIPKNLPLPNGFNLVSFFLLTPLMWVFNSLSSYF